MSVQPNLPTAHKVEACAALKASLDQILKVGAHTQVDYKTNRRYAELIINIHALIGELK
jgi:hypothetical protein